MVANLASQRPEASRSARLRTSNLALSEEDARLLRLASRGLSEAEIAAAIYLSPHTVHHRLERLRYLARVRNRIELAAWAALNGYYTSEAEDPQIDLSPAHLTAGMASARNSV